MRRSLPLLAAALLALPACDTSEHLAPEPNTAPALSQHVRSGDVEVWRTRPDKSELLAYAPTGARLYPVRNVNNAAVIDVDPSQRFQPIVGFGAAVTGSSAYVMAEHLPAYKRRDLLRELFDPEVGIGLSFARVTLGASDFSLSDYTYNDVPSGQEDRDLSEFSIDPDREHVLPVLQQIAGISSDVSFIGSPWSAPAWMKTNGELNGGSKDNPGRLKWSNHGVYAEYLARTVEAFEAEGIPFKAITVQNEPGHRTLSYPSMVMNADQQAVFLGDYVGPLFEQRGLDTEIIAFDHNWDNFNYPQKVFANAKANRYTDGSAFHCYGGDVSSMGQVYANHPDKALYFTECSGGRWATDFGSNLSWNMRNIIIGTTRNGSRSALLWNLALDQSDGPTNGGCSNCRGVVTVNSQTGDVTRNVEYYVLGHAAKAVRPGAVRIGSTDLSGLRIHNVAFQNTDGSRVMIVLNDTNSWKKVQVRVDGRAFHYGVPAGTAVTFRWQ